MEESKYILRERSRSEKAIHCGIPILSHSGKGRAIAIVKRSVVARIWAMGKNA